MADDGYRQHLTHWGAFEARSDGKQLTDVKPHTDDPQPFPLINNVASAQHDAARIDQPYIRRGWLNGERDSPRRGADAFVAVSWHKALKLLSAELCRVYHNYGGSAVYGGSYGWASAGRFHHSQSQLHRFLNCAGGYTASVNSYSFGTSQVLLPHIVGDINTVLLQATSWKSIAEHTDLFLAFGGLSPKNSAVVSGGVRQHTTSTWIGAARARGTEFVSISPLRDDTPPEAEAEWIAAKPGTDAAIMLAMAYILITDNLLDSAFLDQYTSGFEEFADYVTGRADGVAKDPAWAQAITNVSAERIAALSRHMAKTRTMISVSWSLQRSSHGEQPVWLAIVLAAMLGQIGLPGGGFGHGYGSTAYVGEPQPGVAMPSLPQKHNPVDDFIPVARIADMLLHPGEHYRYNGETLTYPDIKLIYWCGGNPFHHHQDLARLRSAFDRPDTIVVHDPFWTATARHADIVLPATMSIERNDIGAGKNQSTLTAMERLTEPAGCARNDYDIFADLARLMGFEHLFTEGRDEMAWLRTLYAQLTEQIGAYDPAAERMDFDEFWQCGTLQVPVGNHDQVLLSGFRAEPVRSRLPTASGKIEISSPTIAAAASPGMPGHPAWIEPDEPFDPDGRYPLQLIANQPRSKLHSQLDVGEHSRSIKINGREPVRMHPDDAAKRGLARGDDVVISSYSGSCLAGLDISDDVASGVAQLSTGAWYDPDPLDSSFCRHGNPNVLTADRATSELTQGCTGGLVAVDVAKAPDGSAQHDAFTPPTSEDAPGAS